jgi:methionyl-tRNA formyltransferase
MVKIGFLGCHEISWHCLKKICELSHISGDKVKIVFNINEEESKKHSAYVNFNSLKEMFGFNLHYITNISNEENLSMLIKNDLDILFIIGWHRIVPQKVLDSAKICLGIHSSLLPKDRGSSPINWQIIRGKKKGGVTLFHLTEGVDSGDIVDKDEYVIESNENVIDIYSKATLSSIKLLEKNWNDIHLMHPNAISQNENSVTLNQRRSPKDGLINWNWNSYQCYNWIRALTKPYPGAFTFWKNQKIYLWGSKISQIHSSTPGQILQTGKQIIISTGKESIEITSLQVEDEPLCNAELFTKSYGLELNDVFTNF